MSRTGRHHKSRMPSRRTCSAVTGVAAVVVAVTAGAVRLPSVAPGDAHDGDARAAQTAQPVSLYVAAGAPSRAGADGRALGGAKASPARSGGSGAVAAEPSQPTASARPSAFAGPPGGHSAPATSTPPPSGAGPVPSLPVPLPTGTPTPSLPGLPDVPNLPTPTSPLPLPAL